MPELPIATGFYEDSSKPIASQECSNWIPQLPQTNALSRMQLKSTQGISQFATAGTSVCRGFHVMNSIAYSVNGNILYRVNSDGTMTNLGSINGASRVSMADNGTQLCIVVPGSTAYIYTVAGGLVTITDTDFTTTLGPSQYVVFKDGYFIHYNNDSAASNQAIFFKSALNDGTSYTALDFGTAEADPDAITGLHVNRNQLYVCGNITIEPFQNVGGADFPFQRIQGAVIQKGVRAKFSLVDFDNSFVFLGGGLNEQSAIWKYSGNSAIKISTGAIDSVIQSLTDSEISGVFATTYAEDGGYFVNFHLKDRTFTYDAAASALSQSPKWHERRSKDTFGKQVNWRVNHIVDAYGFNLAGDNQTGLIGKMDRDVYTEYGTSIKRVVSTMPFHNQGNRVTVGEMELTCESGTANITGAGSDPHVSRSFSDDGGYTFGNETARSLGKQGEYKKRQIWRKEGQFERTRVYRFVIDEPIKTGIFKLEADLQ